MGKVDPTRLGRSAPKVTQDDLEEDVAVVTIASYEEGELDDADAPEGKRATAFLTFKELGDKRLYLNVTQAKVLVERLGESSDKWIGQQVPIEKVTSRFGTKKYEKVSVVTDPEEWEDYVEPAPRRRRRAKRR